MPTTHSLMAAVIAAAAAASASRTAAAAPIFVDPGPIRSKVTALHADLGGLLLTLPGPAPGVPGHGGDLSFDFMFVDGKSLTLPVQTGEFERVDLLVTADDGPIILTQGPTLFYFSDASGAPSYSGLLGGSNLLPPGNQFGWASQVPPPPSAITFFGLHLGGAKGYFLLGQTSAHLLSAEITFYSPATVGRVPEPPAAVLAFVAVVLASFCRRR